jgi:hypothetical protein
MIMLQPLSLSLYTIIESQYLDTINNDDTDDDGNNSTITVDEDKGSIQTTRSSFADEDKSDEDNTTLLSLSRWDADSHSCSSSSCNNSGPPTRPVRRRRNTM